ncbi:hypothetical protein HDU96_008602 [Phlyctochytrium bullatum]|nr:hypothetical protein HDU96_008602 [Phlyctochytrium bullatum]
MAPPSNTLIIVLTVLPALIVLLFAIFHRKGLLSIVRASTARERTRKQLGGMSSVPRVIMERGTGAAINPTERPPPTYFQAAAAGRRGSGPEAPMELTEVVAVGGPADGPQLLRSGSFPPAYSDPPSSPSTSAAPASTTSS